LAIGKHAVQLNSYDPFGKNDLACPVQPVKARHWENDLATSPIRAKFILSSFAMISDSAAPKPLVANEGIKTASHHLRGNLKAEFADTSTAVVSADSEQLIKFHGTYQQDDRDQRIALKKAGKDKAYSFMLRVRLPGGKATAAQWLVLDKLATDFCSPSLRLTTRQTFQFHGVLKGNMKPLIQGMHQVLLDAIAACGDVNRNVMAPVNPEQSLVLEQVYQDAKGWSDYALPKTRAYHEIWLDEELVAGGKRL
jgi:sulfite reductase (NADPH) hemoprotein beta-component